MLMDPDAAAALIKRAAGPRRGPDRLSLADVWRRPSRRHAAGLGAAAGHRPLARQGVRRLSAASLLQLAPARDVAVVLRQGRGEGVAAGAVGDEVEIVHRRRVQRRRQGAAARGWRSARAAGPRCGRCCRDGRSRGRRAAGRARAAPCRRSAHRSPSGRSAAASRVAAGCGTRRRPDDTPSGLAVSFSMIEASTRASSGVRSGRSGRRAAQSCSSAVCMSARIRSHDVGARLRRAGLGRSRAAGCPPPAGAADSPEGSGSPAVANTSSHGQPLGHRDRMQHDLAALEQRHDRLGRHARLERVLARLERAIPAAGAGQRHEGQRMIDRAGRARGDRRSRSRRCHGADRRPSR